MLITGVDVAGRSCVVSEDEVAMNPIGPGFTMAIPYTTASSPPDPRPAGAAELIDQFLAPGVVRWMIVEFGPGADTPMHHTDTLDLQTVLQGSVDLLLDDGAHRLGTGDMAVIAGVDHAWRAGPDGARMNSVLIGTPSP
jgi:quercetin dioxygenase-like cupin family protein